MDIDRRTVLKAAVAAVAAAAVGESVAGCEAGSRRSATSPTARLTGSALSGTGSAPSSSRGPADASPGGESGPAPVTATPGAGGSATEIVHGPPSATGVALTFHGAGDPALAGALLGEIEQGGGQATVLAVGSWLEQYPAMAKRILDGGHELGNHTYHHLTMPRLGSADDDSEIVKCAQLLRRLTGSPGRWFRPSGTTRATPAILAAAGRAGYAESLSFDVDPRDYADPGAAEVTARVLGAVRAGSIVSLHLGHPGTVEAMPAILDGLHRRGLPIVSMSALMAT